MKIYDWIGISLLLICIALGIIYWQLGNNLLGIFCLILLFISYFFLDLGAFWPLWIVEDKKDSVKKRETLIILLVALLILAPMFLFAFVLGIYEYFVFFVIDIVALWLVYMVYNNKVKNRKK